MEPLSLRNFTGRSKQRSAKAKNTRSPLRAILVVEVLGSPLLLYPQNGFKPLNEPNGGALLPIKDLFWSDKTEFSFEQALSHARIELPEIPRLRAAYQKPRGSERHKRMSYSRKVPLRLKGLRPESVVEEQKTYPLVGLRTESLLSTLKV